jgi:hypothetical protein
VNYDYKKFKILDYITSNQTSSGDLILQEDSSEIYYSESNTMLISGNNVLLKSIYKEITHTFSDDKEIVSYMSSTSKYYKVSKLGEFEIFKVDTISEGIEFQYDE